MFTKVYYDAYANAYARDIVRQYNYLKETKGEDRIVIIGTSSASFGFDSEAVKMIEEETGKKVVVFGNFGAMGNTCYLDWANNYITKKDFVVYMYDIYEAAMEISFSGNAALQGIYGNIEMFNRLSEENKCRTIAELPRYIKENMLLYRQRNTDTSTLGVYSLESYDERGIMTYNRRGPGTKTISVGAIYPEMVKDEFAIFVKDWANDLRDRGAKVYFRYGPVIESERVEESTSESINAFEKAWADKSSLVAMNKMEEQYLPANYFYDGSFHLNSNGAKYLASKFIYEYETIVDGHSDYPVYTWDENA